MNQQKHAKNHTHTHQLKCLEVWGGSNHADHLATVPGLDISVHSKPIDDLGGDLYLISSCSSGWITRMLIADVSGHGAGVSELSSKLRKAMHRSINTVDQSRLARDLNAAFDEVSDGSRFATALFMTYYAPSGFLVLVNAGHPPPLICRNGSSRWEPITSSSRGVRTQTSRAIRTGFVNLPLGVIDATDYEQFAVEFRAGDRFCAYTDAYIEASNAHSKQLGVEGLCDMLSECSEHNPQGSHSGSLDSQIRSELTKNGYELADDDHTLMVIEQNGHESTGLSVPVMKNWLLNNFGLGHRDTVV